MMNITNVTGSDSISAIGQALSPIQSTIVGADTTGSSYLMGLLVLILLGAFMVIRRASMEVMFLVYAIAIVGLSSMNYLPSWSTWALAVFIAVIGAMAFLKFRAK